MKIEYGSITFLIDPWFQNQGSGFSAKAVRPEMQGIKCPMSALPDSPESVLKGVAPFGAACQSIVYAAEQIDKEEPYAIMGLFDISQRSAALKDYLSMTMPYKLWEDMMNDLDKSCLTTHSWKRIEERL